MAGEVENDAAKNVSQIRRLSHLSDAAIQELVYDAGERDKVQL